MTNQCPHNEGWEPHQCPECNTERADKMYERQRDVWARWEPPKFVKITNVTKENPDYHKLCYLQDQIFRVKGHNALRQVNISEGGLEAQLGYGEYEAVAEQTEYTCRHCGEKWLEETDHLWIMCPKCKKWSYVRPGVRVKG